MDIRLDGIKTYNRAMRSYVLTLYEMVLEIRPKNILEIGVQNGQSTKTILMALNDCLKLSELDGTVPKNLEPGRLVSIDHKSRQGILDEDYPDLKKFWYFIKGNSHDSATIQAAKNALNENEQYDMFFIDGDHSYKGVKQDWEAYIPMVKPGGIILLHDVTNKNVGVKDFWKEIGWNKFAFNWGRARGHVIPGFGIIKKPYE